MNEEALIEGGELAALCAADAVGGGEEDALFYGQGFDDGAELLDAGTACGCGFFLLWGGFFAGFAVGAFGGLRADGEGGAHDVDSVLMFGPVIAAGIDYALILAAQVLFQDKFVCKSRLRDGLTHAILA